MISVYLVVLFYFFLNDPPPTEIYTYLHTLSLHDALPISQPLAVTVEVRRFARILDALPLPVLALFAPPPLPSRAGQLESGRRSRSTQRCPAKLSRLSPPAPEPRVQTKRRSGGPGMLGPSPAMTAWLGEW